MSRHYKVDKPEHGSEAWLAVRWSDQEGRPRISASAAAAVHNEHPFQTAADLADDLLASSPPEPVAPNKAMERGNRLEPVIVQWAGDMEGIKLSTPEVMYAYEEEGVQLIATLDAIDENGRVYEVKTSNRKFDNQLPRYWYWQGVQQAICTDTNEIEWVVFDSDLAIHRLTQVVTSDEKQMHISACREFLKAIDNGEYPANVDVQYHNVLRQYPQSEGTTAELPESARDLLDLLKATRNQIKEQTALEEDLKTELCLMLGESEYGSLNGSVVCTWKTSTRSSLDSKRFEAEHPALYAKFKKQSTYRTFTIKGAK